LHLYRGTTQGTQTVLDCLAQFSATIAIALPCKNDCALYLGHTPPLRLLKHLTRSRQAPRTNPAAILVPALAMLFATRVSWLIGCYPKGYVTYVRPSGRHSFRLQLLRCQRFLRLERRSCSPTHRHIVCRRYQSFYRNPAVAFLASTLLPLTGKPLLSGLSWLSSSRSMDLPSIPGHITVRKVLSPATLLPTPAHVERSTRDTNPMGGFTTTSL